VDRDELQIVFDYVDPGSYLTWALLDRDGQGEAGWIPLELRPLPHPLLDSDAPEWRAMTGALAEVAGAEDIPFSPPAFLPRTRKAHELGFMAREKGCFDPVHRALFLAHFEHGLDIGRVDVLVGIGVSQGLDRSEVHTVLGVDRFLAEVDGAREAARALAVRGVPTLVRGDRRLEGFQGTDRLREFLAAGGEIAAETHKG
jgi:predicted DsbA family dithiol-disulfide isomerase